MSDLFHDFDFRCFIIVVAYIKAIYNFYYNVSAAASFISLECLKEHLKQVQKVEEDVAMDMIRKIKEIESGFYHSCKEAFPTGATVNNAVTKVTMDLYLGLKVLRKSGMRDIDFNTFYTEIITTVDDILKS